MLFVIVIMLLSLPSSVTVVIVSIVVSVVSMLLSLSLLMWSSSLSSFLLTVINDFKMCDETD